MSERNKSQEQVKRLSLSQHIAAACFFASVAILLVFFILGALSLNRSANRNAQIMARHHSIEVMGQFRSYISPNLVLLQQLSQSSTMSSWFYDVDNEQLRTAAQDEMRRLSEGLPDGNIRMVIREDLRSYSFSNLHPHREFIQEESISNANPYDGWYFHALSSNAPYSFYVAGCNDCHETFVLMISQRVYHQGVSEGTVSVVLSFYEVFDSMFSGFDEGYLQAYLIDRTGVAIIDSSHRGRPDLINIAQFHDMPELVFAHVNAQMRYDGGRIMRVMTPDVFSFARGEYRFGSFLPIPSTEMSIVVLYGSRGAMSGIENYIPLAGGLVFSLIFFSITMYFVVQRLVLQPLNKVVTSAATDSANVYGTDKTDEIGNFARLIQDLYESKHKSKKFDNVLASLTTINSAVNILLQTEIDTFESCLFRSLEMIGESMDVERVYIWEYTRQGGDRYFSQAYEWSKGDTEFTQKRRKIHQLSDANDFEIQLTRGVFVSGTTRAMSPETKDALFLSDVQSYIMVPIYLRGEIWGAIGFANITEKNAFSESDESLIRSFGMLVANTMLRNEMTQNVRTSSSRLHAVISNYPGIIWSVNSDEIITIFNGLTLAGIGVRPSHYEGKHLDELPSSWHDFGIAYHARKAFSEGLQKQNAHVTHISGSVYSIRTAPVFDSSGKITDIVGSIDDITESFHLQEKLERALSDSNMANNAKSEFLSTISHEIRTPMNSIIGFSELAMEEDLPQKTSSYLQKIAENAHGLLQIINDIFDVSKIEAGMIKLESSPFDLAEVFSHCNSLLLPKALAKEIYLTFSAESSPGDKLLVGDPIRLRQIIANLVSNAIKFTDVGGVTVTTTLTNETETTKTIRCEISDTGIGMSKEQITRIFEPFMQADPGITRKYGGAGLGMPIVKNFLKLMGSELKIESTVGAGSKFSFELTFETIASTNELLAKRTTVKDVKKPYFAGEVLVFEDNEVNQVVISEHLSRVGLSYVIAGNGKIGLDILRERITKGEPLFDLILMDIHMPVMDGLDATRRILELNLGIPIVVMTANVMISDKELYTRLGIKDCIGKPFMSQELWLCLLKYLEPIERPESLSDQDDEDADGKLHERVVASFVKNNRETYDNFVESMERGDRKLACRIVHTLRGSSGQIGRDALQAISAEIEDFFETSDAKVPPALMNRLKSELKKALDELAPAYEAYQEKSKRTQIIENTKVPKQEAALLAELENMLKSRSASCLNLLPEISQLPNVETLTSQIESLHFKHALQTLAELKNDWGI